MEKVRAIIVDDEKPARRRLRELLEKQIDIAIVAECSNGAEAARKIRALQPDLLLLDIQMPGLDGDRRGANARHHFRDGLRSVCAEGVRGQRPPLSFEAL